jgi:hypothetical protein
MSKKLFVCVLSIIAAVLLSTACSPKASMPTGAKAEWNLVIIGDSSMWELGDAFADQIEQDLGVKVVVDDFALPALSAGRVLEALETGKSANYRLEKLPDALKTADVVVMFVNPEDSNDPEKPLNFSGCFSGAQPADCPMANFEKYTSDLDAIWANIIELREGQPTILRAVDLYNPLVEMWNRNGIFTECTTCWENMSAAAEQAAKNHGIPFMSRLDLYNGPDHNEDPNDEGYIRGDGEHPTELGAQVTASELATLGYQPDIP